MSARRVAGGLLGLVLLVAGVLVAPGIVDLVPAVVIAVGAALVVLCLLPWTSTVEIAAPMLGKVVLDPGRPRQRTIDLVEDLRELLLAGGSFLCTDEAAAARAVETSIAVARTYWRGSAPGALRVYLLCVLVHQARFESATHPAPVADAHPARLLSRAEREVLLLVDRERLDVSVVAAMLGTSADDVRLHLDRSRAVLDPGVASG